MPAPVPSPAALMKARSWPRSLSRGSEPMKMFGRSKPPRKTGLSARPSCARISSTVRGSAVAVSAIRGTSGKRVASRPSPRYSGRKWWPHWLTQCASSMANSASGRRARKSSVPSSSSRSGETYSSLMAPRARSRLTSRAWSSGRSECSAAAATPCCRIAATWSSIRAMSGETTTPSPGRHSAGTWKHSDLPPPVGMSTSPEPPAITWRTISSWRPRKAGWPKTRCRTSSGASPSVSGLG